MFKKNIKPAPGFLKLIDMQKSPDCDKCNYSKPYVILPLNLCIFFIISFLAALIILSWCMEMKRYSAQFLFKRPLPLFPNMLTSYVRPSFQIPAACVRIPDLFDLPQMDK